MTKVTSGEGRDLADARALQLIGLKNIADEELRIVVIEVESQAEGPP